MKNRKMFEVIRERHAQRRREMIIDTICGILILPMAYIFTCMMFCL